MKKFEDRENILNSRRLAIISNKDNYTKVVDYIEYGEWKTRIEHYEVRVPKGGFCIRHPRNCRGHREDRTREIRYRDEISKQKTCFDEVKYQSELSSIDQQLHEIKKAKKQYLIDEKIKQEAEVKRLAEIQRLKDIETQKQIREIEIENNKVLEKYHEQDLKIHKLISNLTLAERTRFMVKFWGDDSNKEAIEKLNGYKLDVNYLAQLAIEHHKYDLLALAINKGAKCGSFVVADKTLLQILIAQHVDDNIIKQILKNHDDLTVTFIHAFKQHDLISLNKIISLKPEILEQEFHGGKLLHLATAMKEIDFDIVKLIIEHYPAAAKKMTCNGASALQMAVRSGIEKITELVKSYSDVEFELSILKGKINAEMKDKIIERKDINVVIKILKGEVISLEEYNQSFMNITALNDEEEIVFNHHHVNNSLVVVQEGITALQELTLKGDLIRVSEDLLF